MCEAVRFLHADALRQHHFEHPNARLPVSAGRGARIILLPWGRRPRESGQLPAGGLARLSHIQAGLWDAFAPTPVKLPVQAFAMRDVGGRRHWFEITRGQFIQGCVVQAGSTRCVYIVTLDCAPTETVFDRWPRIVSQAPIQPVATRVESR